MECWILDGEVWGLNPTDPVSLWTHLNLYRLLVTCQMTTFRQPGLGVLGRGEISPCAANLDKQSSDVKIKQWKSESQKVIPVLAKVFSGC